MANANKNKGKRGERMICDHLAEVFGLPFQRTPCSGAFTGGSNAWRKKSMSDSQQLLANGDIIVPDELSNLSFESILLILISPLIYFIFISLIFYNTKQLQKN